MRRPFGKARVGGCCNFGRGVLPSCKGLRYGESSGTDFPPEGQGGCGEVNTKAVAWARNQQTGSAITTLVLLQLALRVDSDFACLLSVRTLARATSSGQSTVRRALKALEYQGYVTRDYQFDESGSQRSSRYLLNRPGAHHLSPPVASGDSLDLVLPLDLGGACGGARRGHSSNRHPGIPNRDGVLQHQPKRRSS